MKGAAIMRETFPTSDDMLTSDGRSKYPWRTVKVGESFAVYANEMTHKTLLNYARRVGKRLNRVFKVKEYPENKCSQVALIADNNVVARPNIDHLFNKPNVLKES